MYTGTTIPCTLFCIVVVGMLVHVLYYDVWCSRMSLEEQRGMVYLT